YLGRINKEVVRLESLINELLSTVKQKPLERIRVDLSKIVNEVLSNELENLKNSNISVTKKFKPNIWVNVDEKRVYQVLLNLIINARDAMKDGGKLFVKTHSEGMWQTVEVIDSGNGISEDAATMIFTPFFTTKAEGTGLGLSICDEIIKAHGGRIAFSSDDLGTVFSIRLPRE
ncbi:MAG: sensor histidine kinase, partial [Caldisericia bacterium]|nr:sensor histidine kinase [Caldisericia bacterium]